MQNRLRSLTAPFTLSQPSPRAPWRFDREPVGQTRGLKALCLGAVLSSPIMIASTAQVAAAEPLDATASDPENMEWMVGFPPPLDKVIAYPSSNYFSFPRLRWTFCHFREMQATRLVGRGLGPRSVLPEAIDGLINIVLGDDGGGNSAWERL